MSASIPNVRLSRRSPISRRVSSTSTATTSCRTLLEREKLGSTGVGLGVAVPHAALAGLDRMYGIFIRLESPVAYDSIDDMPVDLIFALLAPENAGTEHLRALAKVSRVLRQKDIRDQLRRIDNPNAIYAVLTGVANSNAA